MTVVRALADDLTGAFDAGAAFVGMCGPIEVSWRSAAARQAGSLVFDNEARAEPNPDVAANRTQNDLALINGADISFKKIDSLMRGHTVAELQACMAAKRFPSMVLAPSFPAQGRVTRAAQQYVRSEDVGRWQPVGPNLVLALSTTETTRHVGADDIAGGAGVFVCDAESEEDMRSLPMRLSDVEPPILWCGSAGLARAITSVPTAPSRLPREPSLIVIGTNHPVSQAQLEALERSKPSTMCVVDGTQSLDEIRDYLSRRLADGNSAVVATSHEPVEAETARLRIAQVIKGVLPYLPIPTHLIVTGGETLRMVLDAVGAQSAFVKGEVMPGIAIGQAIGGGWDGVTFASKSGAFGAPSLLVDLLTGVGETSP